MKSTLPRDKVPQFVAELERDVREHVLEGESFQCWAFDVYEEDDQ